MTSPRRTAVAFALLSAAMGAAAVVSPVVRTTLRSPRAVTVIVAVAAATAFAARRASRRWGSGAGTAARVVALSMVAWFLVLPAFRQTTSDEALPTSAAAAPSAAAPDRTAAPGRPPATPSADPELATTGRLIGIDHQAAGSVSVYRTADGAAFVRFDDIDVKGAPDPVLYLVPGADKSSREGGVVVGPLEATKGSFNQPVPPSFDLDGPFTVFIWCEQYATPIAKAAQSAQSAT